MEKPENEARWLCKCAVEHARTLGARAGRMEQNNDSRMLAAYRKHAEKNRSGSKGEGEAHEILN